MSNQSFIISAQLPGEAHSHYARHNILRNIMMCNLKPGDVIDEQSIAEHLNISRTPVHEAVLSLRDARLIDVIPRKESRVSYINLEYINEGVFLRCTLEAALLRDLSGNLSSKYLSILKKNLDMQHEVFADKQDLDSYYALDDEFHRYLYIAGNKMLTYQSVSSICSHLDRVRYMVRLENDVEIEEASLKEHFDMLTFLSTGIEPEQDLDRFFRRHIMRFQSKLPKYMEKYQNYFVL